MRHLIPRFRPQYNFKEWISAFSIFKKDAVTRYEKSFANMFACKFGVMFSHGRSGIYALLKQWELTNAEIICPAYTCVVVPNAIVLSGNTPIFVDCENDSFNMSISGIEQQITARTRVIIATHLFGYPMNVKAVQEIADRYSKMHGNKIYVIQDCAHSYGAKWNDELITSFGDAAIFGSNISKIINSIFGGMVITRDEETYLKLKQWRANHCKAGGLKKSLARLIYFIMVNLAFCPPIYSLVNWMEKKGLLDHFTKYYEEGKIEFPADWDLQPSNIEARVGLVQLEKYNSIVDNRIALGKRIIHSMKSDPSIKFQPDDKGATYSHLVGIVENRDEWVAKYDKQSVQLGILIEYSIPSMKAYESYRTSDTPNSDYLANHCINFPLSINWYKS